jgi:pimeloyl-ACP methyl ester carboxylesterase
MTEKIRRIHDPTVEPDGSQVVHSIATPESFDMRAGTTIGSNKVIPVIFVPGIMGTNLRVRRDVKLPEDYPLKGGDPAWRPPNSKAEGLLEARKWSKRNPGERQMILNPDFLEIDETGELDVGTCSLTRDVMRERGWGEIFNGSYGTLLYELQSHLDMTFRVNNLGQREIREHWQTVMKCDPWRQWGVRNVELVTEGELEKYAAYQYPLYAVGYNWLQSSALSAQRLEKRVNEIIKWWRDRKYKCSQVILVTHSMGGLVARACAKRIPGSIAGVIHGVMPALGAPVAYRRIACGTEKSSPSNDTYQNFVAEKFAEVAGKTAAETTPVMAVSPGVLELLPNHRYPRPWLHVRVMRSIDKKRYAYDYLHLPTEENPYDFYRDTKAWYRLINPALADPRGLHRRKPGGVIQVISNAIDAAEKFHLELGDSYHKTSFAFYGNDKERLSYGEIRWVANEVPASTSVALASGNVQKARLVGYADDGARVVEVEGKCLLRFELDQQDASGDDTVPHQSGAAPSAFISQIFATRGYSHQDSFGDSNMILLTRHLIVKIVQGLK